MPSSGTLKVQNRPVCGSRHAASFICRRRVCARLPLAQCTLRRFRDCRRLSDSAYVR